MLSLALLAATAPVQATTPPVAQPAATPYVLPMRGADISWPNCPKGMGVAGRRTLGLPLPTAASQFVVVGLTNGRAFTRNPCIAWHMEVVAQRRLPVAGYTMLSYPTSAELARHGRRGPYPTGTLSGRLSNYGYAQSAFALDAAQSAGIAAPVVWIDVEPRRERPWSRRTARNRALISGALQAVADRGLTAGIYSYAYGWKQITGSWTLEAPVWMPSGSHARTWARRRSDAVSACSRSSFSGGAVVMTQWVWRNRDYDVTCPAMTDVASWFQLPTGAIASPTPATTASAGAPPA